MSYYTAMFRDFSFSKVHTDGGCMVVVLRMASCKSSVQEMGLLLSEMQYKSSTFPVDIKQKIHPHAINARDTSNNSTSHSFIFLNQHPKASKTLLLSNPQPFKMAPTQILLTLALAILSPLTTATPTPPAQDPSLAQFEERFVNSLPYTSDNATTLRLVGFKRMALPAADVAAFEEAWNAPPSEWRRRRDEGSAAGRHEQHFWYDRARREVRVYFPVEGALLRRSAVEEGGNVFVEADGLGQVVGVGEVVKRDVDGEGRARAVVGRRATDQVSGVEGNVIRDGIMYVFSCPFIPSPFFTVCLSKQLEQVY